MISDARIVTPGMGGFLNPPGHPKHSFHVAWGKSSRDDGACSLTHAVGDGARYLPEAIVEKARALLYEWEQEKGDPEPDWVHKMLGYFRNCYRNPTWQGDEQWHGDKVIIDSSRDPIVSADDHAGVHHIRSFYPDFMPSRDDFAKAYWGKKP